MGPSVVDRATVVKVPCPDASPSLRDGVSVDVERKHRLYGTFLIASATRLLAMGPYAYPTACTIFHRFFHRASLKQFDVWSVSLASVLLASKLQDGPQRPMRHFIVIFHHLYCKQVAEDGKRFREIRPLNKLGPIWKEWYQAMVTTENQILRYLGFTLHWIADSHPHKFLLEVLRVLGLNDDVELAKKAWNYCNDSYRLDLCVRFDAEVIACASIHLASIDVGRSLPTSPTPWWEMILGSGSNSEVTTILNAILGLLEYLKEGHTSFVCSLVPAGSFNDPESFLFDATR